MYSVNLRIEGANDTIFEGPLKIGPRTITTPTGGTHICEWLQYITSRDHYLCH
jgi:hypothetical protein